MLCAVLTGSIDCIGKVVGDGSHSNIESPPTELDLTGGILNNFNYALGLDKDGKLLCWGKDPTLAEGEQTMCEKIMGMTRFKSGG
jgi:hypothetical protein